jgi:diguanylate cyclase (GGDEF)-like protein
MTGPKRVLVVDDEQSILNSLSDILEYAGYEVYTSEDGKGAIEIIEKVRLDAAVVDIKLPDISGMEVLKRIIRRDDEVCVILFTGYATLGTAVKALDEGAYDFITKPFDIEKLKYVLRRGIELYKARRQNIELAKRLEMADRKLDIARRRLSDERLMYEAVIEAGQEMCATLRTDALNRIILEKATEIVDAARGSLMLLDDNEWLVVKSAKGINDGLAREVKVRLGEGIAGWVAKTGQPLLVKNIEHHEKFKRKNRSGYATKSFLSLPIRVREEISGVLNISDKYTSGVAGVFTEKDLDVLSAFVDSSGVALENAFLFEKANQAAITDALTEVYNQRFLGVRLEEEIKRARRYNHNLSIAVFDIDFFKHYNDTNGHMLGNEVLREIARIIRLSTREIDIVSRFGGEEFVVVFPETDLSGALVRCEKIRKEIYERPFPGEEKQPLGVLTISGGVAELEDPFCEWKALIDKADMALYRAKRLGRNRIDGWYNQLR